jgi:hypothetical protein
MYRMASRGKAGSVILAGDLNSNYLVGSEGSADYSICLLSDTSSFRFCTDERMRCATIAFGHA